MIPNSISAIAGMFNFHKLRREYHIFRLIPTAASCGVLEEIKCFSLLPNQDSEA